MDNGDILDQRKFSISQNDDASSLYTTMTNLGKQMILYNLVILKDAVGWFFTSKSGNKIDGRYIFATESSASKNDLIF